MVTQTYFPDDPLFALDPMYQSIVMSRTPGDLTATAGQTVGPFFHYALPYPGDSEMVPPGRADAIRFHGVVRDGAGDPVPDALLEIWQADAEGRVVQEPGSLRRDGFTFTGWGRAATDAFDIRLQGEGETAFLRHPRH